MKTFVERLLPAWISSSLKVAVGNRLLQIGIAFVIVLSVALIIDEVKASVRERDRAIADANVRLRNLAQSMAAHADSALLLADTIGASIVVQLETDGITPPSLLRLQTMTRLHRARLSELNDAIVLGETGNLLMGSATSSASAPRHEREYFVFHRSNAGSAAHIGAPIRAYSNDHWVIPVTHRFNHPDGRFAGVVVVSIELSYFEVFYRSLQGYEDGVIALFFEDLSLLASNQPPRSSLLALDSALDRAKLRGTAASVTSVTPVTPVTPVTAKIGGLEWQYGHAHLQRYGLVAIVSAQRDTVLRQWRESTWHTALSSFLRLLLLALLGAILLVQMRSRHKAENVLDEKAMQFRMVIDRIEDYGIYTLDTAGIVTSWNAGAQRLTGFTAEEIVGVPCSALYSAEDVAAGCPERTLAETLKSGRNEDERKRLRKDGTHFMVNVITTPLFGLSGQHYGFLKVGRDVTASRQSEALLVASEFRWKFALEGAGAGVWDRNEQTGVINFSRPYMTMLGYEENEIEGTFEGWKPLIHPEDLKGIYLAYSAHLEGRAPHYMQEYRIRCKDGSYKWVVARGMVVSRDEAGKALRTIGTQADISQLKAAEQRMNEQNALMKQTNEQLQKANQVKSEFLANMSHELRTPLNAVLGFTGTLLMELPGPLNSEQKKQLEAVRTSGRHLLELINEILDLSKIESGMIEISAREFNCQDLITEVGHLLMPLASEKAVSLSMDLPHEAIRICSDLRLVKQILINLIGNAIKFTEAGGVTVRLTEAQAPHTNHVAIDVIDTGIGIDDADLNKLFMPFTQLESGLARRFEGTGLGLNLSKKYADLLSATLLVRSVPGEGTTFSLQLPRSPSLS